MGVSDLLNSRIPEEEEEKEEGKHSARIQRRYLPTSCDISALCQQRTTNNIRIMGMVIFP